MKKLTLAACLLILTNCCQQTQARSIPMAIGGAALVAYFGHGAYHCFTIMAKSDEEMTAVVEQQFLSLQQEDPTLVITVQPKEVVSFTRKFTRIALPCFIAITGLGGYLVKKGLTA